MTRLLVFTRLIGPGEMRSSTARDREWIIQVPLFEERTPSPAVLPLYWSAPYTVYAVSW